MRNSWNTEMPDTRDIGVHADKLAEEGFDVHTVSIVLDGQHGGWNVAMLATDEELDDHRFEFIMERYGSLERV